MGTGKQALINLSNGERSHIRKLIIFTTFIYTVVTLLVSAIFIKYFSLTIINPELFMSI